VAVYSAHLPLDCHYEVGNNAVLARTLGIENLEPFGEFKQFAIGFAGTVHLSLKEFVSRVHNAVGSEPRVLQGGPSEIRRVGVITGGGASMIEEAQRTGLDTFVTGEASHHTHFDAVEGGINVLLAGHYATETFGVRALAAHIAERFGLPWTFFDNPTGL
jgi:dinuclear metal center YbgI/SA1388 family protein